MGRLPAAFLAMLAASALAGRAMAGSCCLPDGTCQDVPGDITIADCVAAGGAFEPDIDCPGVGIDCGVCCLIDECRLTPTQAACEGVSEGIGGTWLGTGITCTTGVCAGACTDRLTLDTILANFLTECLNIDTGGGPPPPNEPPGLFAGVATSIADAGDAAIGACCYGGACVDVTSLAECDALGGTFLGAGTRCLDVPTPCFAEVQTAFLVGSLPVSGTFIADFARFDPLPGGVERELIGLWFDLDQTLTASVAVTNLDVQANVNLTVFAVSEAAFPTQLLPSARIVDLEFNEDQARFAVGIPPGATVEFGDFVYGFEPLTDLDDPAADGIATQPGGELDARVMLMEPGDDLSFYVLGPGQTSDLELEVDPQITWSVTGPADADVNIRNSTDTVFARLTYFFLPSGEIRGRIWDDAGDCDGCQDAPALEPGVEDAIVELWLVDGGGEILVATTTTDADGNYEFLDLDFNLPGETYEVRVDRATLPAGYDAYDWTLANAACDPDPAVSDTLDSDMLESPGSTIGVIPGIVISEADPISEFNDGGLIEPDFAISGILWLDENEDGCRDAGEPRLSGVDVELWRISPGPAAKVADDVTDGLGAYSFDDAAIDGDAGDVYEVRIPFFSPGPPAVNPALEDPGFPGFSYLLTLANQSCGGDETRDSDFTSGGAFAVVQVTLLVDEDLQDPIDLCLYPQQRDAGFRPFAEEEQCGCREKGSLLIFHKIDLRWDEAGNLVQNTFLQFVNDFPQGVRLQGYIVNGDDPVFDPDTGAMVEPGWNFADIGFELTKDQTFYYDCSTGATTNGGVTPFTVLDPDGRPATDGPDGERMLRGFMLLWAVDANNEEVRWNHLAGTGTLINYPRNWSWEYRACSSVVVAPVANGQAPDAVPGQLLLDGFEYSAMPGLQLNTFNAVGSNALSRGVGIVTDNDLTFLPVSTDLRANESEGPTVTHLQVNIWNENEVKFSNTSRCIRCWDETLMSDYEEPNQFLVGVLQTNFGKARYDGVSSPTCDGSIDAAIVGLRAGIYAFSDGRFAASAVEMVDLGCENAVIRYDPLGAPPEAPQEIGRRRGESIESWLVRVAPELSDRID